MENLIVICRPANIHLIQRVAVLCGLQGGCSLAVASIIHINIQVDKIPALYIADIEVDYIALPLGIGIRFKGVVYNAVNQLFACHNRKMFSNSRK